MSNILFLSIITDVCTSENVNIDSGKALPISPPGLVDPDWSLDGTNSISDVSNSALVLRANNGLDFFVI